MSDIYIPAQKQPSNIKNILIRTGLLILVAIALYWLYGHAFIRIDAKGTNGTNFTYKLTNQKNGTITTVESQSGSIKKLVARGNYEILVTQGENSYFKTLRTGSFLSTKAVEAQLQPENLRSFVGNNPEPCMEYANSLLFSYNCDGNAESLKVHLPATNSTPTIVQPPTNTPTGSPIGGSAQVNGKVVVLLNGRITGEDDVIPPTLYEVGEDLKLNSANILSSLDGTVAYKIQSYKKGFVIYDDSLANIFYYANPTAQPEKISIPSPKNSELQPFELLVQNDNLIAAYSFVASMEDAGDDPRRTQDETKISKGKSEFVFYGDGKTKNFVFDSAYTHAEACGLKYLCIINGPTLKAYDTSGDKLKEQFEMNSVTSILEAEDRLIAVRDQDILSIDIASGTGYVMYGFGGYIPCGGSSVQDGGYLFCVTGPRNTRSALYIDSKQPNKGSIDKKVLTLLDLPYVDAVSAYKSFVYVVPNLGDPVYDAETRSYLPNPAIKQKTADDINKIINELGIDRSLYTVINTQP